jgi:hypothetical protein
MEGCLDTGFVGGRRFFVVGYCRFLPDTFVLAISSTKNAYNAC